MGWRRMICAVVASTTLAHAEPATKPVSSIRYIGGDVSMVSEIERMGGSWESACGDREDAITILRDDDWNLFRVRVFVNPSGDYQSTRCATQSLDVARELARRIHRQGGKLFLCLHYSDTWADSYHQAKPAAWEALPFDALEAKVHEYTASVLAALKEDGIVPEIVQVGNEITAGMLWPDGKVEGVVEMDRPAQWAKLSRLFNAGARAVREASTPRHPIRVALHVHGGGRIDVKGRFLDHLVDADYDIIGLSFYPVWGERLETLEAQLASLREKTGKEILIAETAYPHKAVAIEESYMPFLAWPRTPAGQARFAQDLRRAVEQAGGIGIVWWYPEAIPIKGHAVYGDGAESLFDEKGRRLEAVDRLIGLN